jgi:hypothetical protein
MSLVRIEAEWFRKALEKSQERMKVLIAQELKKAGLKLMAEAKVTYNEAQLPGSDWVELEGQLPMTDEGRKILEEWLDETLSSRKQADEPVIVKEKE